LHLLTEELPQPLKDVPIETLQAVWFMYDGAHSRFTRDVKEFLDCHYSDRLTGRNKPVLWPPRSPDRTPSDFHLWDQLKGNVYSKGVNTRDKLWRPIQAVAPTIRQTPGIFQCILNSWRHKGSVVFSGFSAAFVNIKMPLCGFLMN
jgi:hypothetical protein